MKKQTILFMCADPEGTNQLALGREARAIEEELRCTGRDYFEFETRWAAHPLDLLRALRMKPEVVHFSGRVASRPNLHGLCFQNERGESQLVAAEALAATFAACGDSVKLVVLNACYSDEQAQALISAVPCVIGTIGPTGEVTEADGAAARGFAIGLYGGLGNGGSVAQAYEQGCAALGLMTNRIQQGPGRLQTRPGVDATQLVLATLPPVVVRAPPPPERSDVHDLFVTHPRTSTASARELVQQLQPDLRVFLSCQLPSAEDRDAVIATAHRKSRATVLLISSRADAAWYLGTEVLTALALHRASPATHPLVPVLLEPGIDMPRCLRGIEPIDAVAVGSLPGIAARLRDQVEALRRDAAPWIPPPEPVTYRRAAGDHFKIHKRLSRLTDALFDQIVASAKIDPDSVARRGVAIADRALDVAQLAALDPALSRRLIRELELQAPWIQR